MPCFTPCSMSVPYAPSLLYSLCVSCTRAVIFIFHLEFRPACKRCPVYIRDDLVRLKFHYSPPNLPLLLHDTSREQVNIPLDDSYLWHLVLVTSPRSCLLYGLWLSVALRTNHFVNKTADGAFPDGTPRPGVPPRASTHRRHRTIADVMLSLFLASEARTSDREN